MAKAKKLPSGSWRARAYSHTTPDGKKHYESFTASTRQEAEMLASQFSNNRESRSKVFDLTVSDAIDRYISMKTAVLSPSTIRGYRQIQRVYFNDIGKLKVKKIDNATLQCFVSDLATKLSAKTVRNVYGLLISSITYFAPDKHFNVTMPMKSASLNESPSEEQVMELYEDAPEWLQKCIALGAFGGLRRGEIAALKFKDIKDGCIYVHCDMVQDEHKHWLLKEMPKTVKSVRMVKVPAEVLDLLGNGKANDFVIGVKPDKITKGFSRLKQKHNISFTFHDMRHFYASIAAILGIPDIVIADFGGWEHDSKILKRTYQGNIKSISDGYSDKLNDHFGNLLKKV